MGEDLCFLITLYYERHGTLIRCALKTRRNALPVDAADYPMEHRDALHKLLPEHVRSCGPIVEVEPLFEVV